MNINVINNDGENSVYWFPENIDVYVLADIDFTKMASKNKNKIVSEK